ncbi:MAG TPA: 7TM diverse intracellular signaling domain-containing protein, partial [Panacibacter sp.]|nr:7TM diverse intracellular signaling domain-containing protein [Panacibacter sp.]HNP43453.1 7TM diverse intracellular signaling domain-containing protein [Panacibacter sp.]
MKHSIFTLALFYFFNLASAQDVLHIESIPTQVSAFQTGVGIPLNTGWKWKDGDSLAWSRPDFDDHLWQPINPLLDVHDSLPQLPKSSVFWLRTLFILNTAIQKRQLALLIQQTGASEVYLNGELIKSFGIINTDPGKTFAYNPAFLPVLLPVNNKDTQVLAIRYLLDKNAHYTKAFATTNPLFEAKLQYASEATSNYYLNIQLLNNYYFFATGLFFLLALIHVSYYFFQKAQRANLFFALYALCYIAFIQSSVVIDTHIVSDKYYALTTGLLLIIIIGPLLLTAIYELLHAKKDWIYKTLLLFSGISAIMYFWQYEWGWHAGADIMSLLIQIAIVRIVFKAVYQKKKGARILAVGSIIFLISFGLFILISLFSPQNLLLMNLFFVFGVLSIPLATSIYLGLEFGFLNFALQGKLVEVSELSIKNINQEKEKQQILANQNETLEKQVAERTAELQQSLQNLKSTQAQLIQSEKMASLGELTAGI